MKNTKRTAIGSASAIALALALATASHASIATTSVQEAPEFEAAKIAAESVDWANDESERGGLKLIAQYDSSGPDAWDVEKHPLVYISSESHQNNNMDRSLDGSFAGFHLVDGETHEIVGSFIGTNSDSFTQIVRGPHGVSVSPDGKWGYVGWEERVRGEDLRQAGFVAVVNMRTLKIDKLLRQESYFRGAKRSQSLHHVQSCSTEEDQQRVFLQFGFGANGGPHFILNPDDDNRVERAVNYDDIHVMGHPFTTPSPDCNTMYVSVGSSDIIHNTAPAAGVSKLDLTTGQVASIMGTGNHPIGITHTMDGKFTFVVDAHGSRIYKVDNATNKIVGDTGAGVGGPYGVALNWDESILFTIGKGEGIHNVGQVIGFVDADRMTPYVGPITQQPLALGRSAAAIEHAMLHPDPAKNELWVSNQKGWETIVLDLNTFEPKAYIPTPHGGDTHSGAFIRYDADWNGEVMVDQGGPVSKEMQATVLAMANERKGVGSDKPEVAKLDLSTMSKDEVLAAGKLLFEETAGHVGCASCHGMDGSGDIGPDIRGKDDLDITGALQAVTEMNFLLATIHHTSAEVKAIGAYLQTLGE